MRKLTVLGVPIDSVAAPDGGPLFGTETAPDALRSLGLPARLGADDAGNLDVRIVGPERDSESGLVGWPSLAACTRAIRAAVAEMLAEGAVPLVLGGCCALVMGAAAGMRDVVGPAGLVSVDGHVDLYDHTTSPTGEAADVPVAALLGRGWPGLLETIAPVPVMPGSAVVAVGARDPDEAADLGNLPAGLGVTVRSADEVLADPGAVAVSTLERFRSAGTPFWLHLDVDVLDEVVFPATDYLMPGGLGLRALAAVLSPLARDPLIAGMSVGCYNPSKDPDGRSGADLTDLLVEVLSA
jgi:arginase